MGTISSDEVVKGVMFGYMHEHYEIAAYRVLIAAAEECERPEIGEICQRLLTEEEAMQQWLLNHIGEITQQYLARLENHPETAKR